MNAHWVMRWRSFSVRLHRRSVLLALALLTIAIAASLGALTLPGAGIGSDEAWDVLLRGASGFASTVVLDWRLPRVVAALVIGAALAASGAIFQALTRNPLGSPDVIGFNTGAYTGVLFMMIGGATGFAAVATGALVGGVLTAIAVYLISLRSGSAGLRMVVVGLGISAMLSALNRWLIGWGELDLSLAAASWGAGSLNGVRWPQVALAGTTLVIILAAAVLLARRLNALGLGDDAAAGLGLPIRTTRLLLVLVGVALTAAATALAGPISFVALAAPHIAHRLSAATRISLVPVALTGALLLLISDLLAQRAFAPTQLPVGIVTVTVGGIYLVALLGKASRRA